MRRILLLMMVLMMSGCFDLGGGVTYANVDHVNVMVNGDTALPQKCPVCEVCQTQQTPWIRYENYNFTGLFNFTNQYPNDWWYLDSGTHLIPVSRRLR